MNFFAITRHGLATIAVLVGALWTIVLATEVSQHRTAIEAERLHLRWGKHDLHRVSQCPPQVPAMSRNRV